MPARIILLITSPRLPAGLLSAAAWDTVRSRPVFAAAPGPQVDALRAAGVPVTLTDTPVDSLLAAGDAVWLAGPGGDEELARQLGLRLVREPGSADLEVLYGSWDPPGARLLDAVRVVDRLAEPGGDPWLRQFTTAGSGGRGHRDLARFLLEEAYEAYDAIDAGDPDALREELGDVLFQVVLHARLAQGPPEHEHPGAAQSRWGIDDVAGDLVAKLIRRNPHVFGAAERTEDVTAITEQWERIKQAERARKDRSGPLGGVVWSQPALALAGTVLDRAARAGVPVELPRGDELGARLLRLVATDPGDTESALRRAVRALAEQIEAASAGQIEPPAGETGRGD